MERTKKYIKTFVTIGVCAGILFGLAMSRKVGFSKGLLMGVKFGSGCAAGMALILAPFDYFMTRKFPAIALNVNQEREIRVSGALDDIFHKCLELLRKLKTIKSVSPSQEDLQISARTCTSFVSIGEVITLNFKESANGFVKIEIRSNPAIRFTMLDYGKNFRNAELIREKLETGLRHSTLS